MRREEIKLEIIANSKEELLSFLKKNNIVVPGRSEGRETDDCEKWPFYHLLATWAKKDIINYPIKIIHKDKPDFRLNYGGSTTGIEVTEAVQQEYAEIDALAEKMGENPIFLMDTFSFKSPKRTREEKIEIIKNPPMGEGWGGHGMSKEWALWIFKSISEKTNKFEKNDFRKCDINLLLIYDNLCLNFDDETSLNELKIILEDYWNSENTYDKILIISGKQLYEINKNKVSIIPLFDLLEN